jgi:hypothetical protein
MAEKRCPLPLNGIPYIVRLGLKLTRITTRAAIKGLNGEGLYPILLCILHSNLGGSAFRFQYSEG